MENIELSNQVLHSLKNIGEQFYQVLYKEVKRNMVLEGKDYEAGVFAGKQEVLKKLPVWKISNTDDYVETTTLTTSAEFGPRILRRGQLIKAGWKYIPIRDLKVLGTEVDKDKTDI